LKKIRNEKKKNKDRKEGKEKGREERGKRREERRGGTYYQDPFSSITFGYDCIRDVSISVGSLTFLTVTLCALTVDMEPSAALTRNFILSGN
jgi:hypothetical protein